MVTLASNNCILTANPSDTYVVAMTNNQNVTPCVVDNLYISIVTWT
jgi:hypothetical protein